MSEPDSKLFADHVAALADRYANALADTGFDAVLLGAGTESLHFLDDQGPAFKPNPHLQQWFPAEHQPAACLLVRPSAMPVAVVCQPDDYWHAPPAPPASPWADEIEIRVVSKPDAVNAALPELPARLALIAPPGQFEGGPRRRAESGGPDRSPALRTRGQNRLGGGAVARGHSRRRGRPPRRKTGL